jgi:predicted Zn-dependent protease
MDNRRDMRRAFSHRAKTHCAGGTGTRWNPGPVRNVSRDVSARLSRRRWVCGVCATGALACLPAFASPAAADEEHERAIGRQVYDDQRRQGQILDVSPFYPVLRQVGRRIAAAAAPHWWPANFIIVKGTQPNAFSTPGGWVYVNETLLTMAADEDELANVVGHETGHIVLGHVMNRLKQAQNLDLLLTLGGLFVHSQAAANVYAVARLGATYGFLNFSRQQEYQADHEGVILAAKAAYNPWGMIWFFRTLSRTSGSSAGFEQYVQDHPATPDRIKRLEAFFASDPARFGKWKDRKPAATGLRRVPGARLVLTQS